MNIATILATVLPPLVTAVLGAIYGHRRATKKHAAAAAAAKNAAS